jgi:hypothetical protein
MLFPHTQYLNKSVCVKKRSEKVQPEISRFILGQFADRPHLIAQNVRVRDAFTDAPERAMSSPAKKSRAGIKTRASGSAG